VKHPVLLLLGVLAAIGACALVAGAKAGAEDVHGPAPLAADQGPVDRRAPPDAFFADDENALAVALGDPRGPGEIWLRGRTYPGDFVVARPVALHGEPGAVLEGTGTGTVLAVSADDAWIDNLTVRHSGRRHTVEDSGIKVKAARVRVTHVAVEDALFGVVFEPCPGCTLEDSRIRGTADDPELRGDGVKLWESADASVRG